MKKWLVYWFNIYGILGSEAKIEDLVPMLVLLDIGQTIHETIKE